ncbi:MAG: TlyA family RNA methyltransferase [Clostridia bacterium]|nr:TlyA family RNA methyltransferase [Clostridia bacterium]
MADNMRLDAALVGRGLAPSRERAKEYIAAGQVTVNGVPATKASQSVTETDEITCGASEKYVGRGGYKLEKALSDGALDLSGRVAMDVGASTGGFTQCLLNAGAARVFSVDVGRDQLHPSLRTDPRVCCMESTDVRDRARMSAQVADSSVDFCAVDVSFISLRLILPAALPYLKPGADVVCLVKPQFEAGRAAIGKRGVVRDAKDHLRVLRELSEMWAACHLQAVRLTPSPIRGGDGNVEYLATLRYQPDTAGDPLPSAAIEAAVRAAQERIQEKSI